MRLAFDTERLAGRLFRDADAADIAAIAGDVDVARMTGSIPHPYGVESAEGWILTHWGKRRRGVDHTFAVIRKNDGALVGSAGLFKRRAGSMWELGYMLGRNFWGRGYATEAARGVIAWGRAELGAEAITASVFADNPASARVLEKAGFVSTGERSVAYCVARQAPMAMLGHELAADATEAGAASRLRDAG